jgi:hypothetical protein
MALRSRRKRILELVDIVSEAASDSLKHAGWARVELSGGFIMARRTIAVVCATILGGFASVAEAATLNVNHGEVLLSRGAGYQTVKGSADLLVGDTVLGKPDSAAQIAFADGCTIPLGVGTVFRVGTMSPCKPHSAGAGASGATETPEGGGWWNPGWNPASWNENGWMSNPVIPLLITAGVVGGIVAVVESGHSSIGGSNPASPN